MILTHLVKLFRLIRRLCANRVPKKYILKFPTLKSILSTVDETISDNFHHCPLAPFVRFDCDIFCHRHRRFRFLFYRGLFAARQHLSRHRNRDDRRLRRFVAENDGGQSVCDFLYARRRRDGFVCFDDAGADAFSGGIDRNVRLAAKGKRNGKTTRSLYRLRRGSRRQTHYSLAAKAENSVCRDRARGAQSRARRRQRRIRHHRRRDAGRNARNKPESNARKVWRAVWRTTRRTFTSC